MAAIFHSLLLINQRPRKLKKQLYLLSIIHLIVSDFSDFFFFLSELVLRFDKIIIIHDFNTDIDGENESLDINVIFFN